MKPNLFSTADVAAPAANTAAVLNYAADAVKKHCLGGLCWSLDGAPAAGTTLKVEDGSGNVVFGPHAITQSGPGVVYFLPPKVGSLNTAMIATLSAAGNGVSGVLSALAHWKE